MHMHSKHLLSRCLACRSVAVDALKFEANTNKGTGGQKEKKKKKRRKRKEKAKEKGKKEGKQIRVVQSLKKKAICITYNLNV